MEKNHQEKVSLYWVHKKSSEHLDFTKSGAKKVFKKIKIWGVWSIIITKKNIDFLTENEEPIKKYYAEKE